MKALGALLIGAAMGLILVLAWDRQEPCEETAETILARELVRSAAP